MAFARIGLAILAAGAASRFGARKLTASLGKEMIGIIAAKQLANLDFSAKVAVCSPDDTALVAGFEALNFTPYLNNAPALGLSHSISIATQAFDLNAIDGLLICLADMPNITARHIMAMHSAFVSTGGMRTIASSCEGITMPPVLFARSDFGLLERLSGDQGARALLSAATVIEADSWVMADIDTREDLERISRLYRLSKVHGQDPS